MNVIHIISSRGWGGAENSAVYLAKKQIEKGNRVFFFIHSLNEKLKYVLKANGVPYFSIFDPEKKNIFAIKKVINICGWEKIDIIHTHLATGNYIGILAGNYLKMPVVSTINTFCCFPYYAFADSLCFASESVKKFFLRYFASYEYLSYSPPLAENLINKYFGFNYAEFSGRKKIEDKSEIAYERIDESNFIDFSENSVPDYLLNFKNFFNIGMTGRVTEQKGQLYLIEAAGMLVNDKKNGKLNIRKDLMFHIIGSGREDKKLKKLTKQKGLSENFRFWGYQKDIRPFVKIFDIAISCSIEEPFGTNLIEYMFMKKPIIATRVGGIPEVIGDTNILVPPKDPEKLKEALRTYINNPDLMKSEAESGFERAKNKFSSELSINTVMSVYNKLVPHI